MFALINIHEGRDKLKTGEELVYFYLFQKGGSFGPPCVQA